jgi:hypothetical protein
VRDDDRQEAAMGVYSPLRHFLNSQSHEHVPMSFAEIEAIIGRPLPASKQYPAWWSNNPSNNPMTREWLSAGFQTESVNTVSGKLVFRRVENGNIEKLAKPRAKSFPFGFMKGMITIAPGHDVTKPLDEDWPEPYLGTEEDR